MSLGKGEKFMLIQTKFLGEVEINKSEILSFNQGLPGFPEYQQFIILSLDADLPLALLQSIEEESIGFVVAFPFAFKQDYTFDLSDEDKEDLQIEKEEDVLTYSIVTLQETFVDSTINLLAPVIINVNKKLGKQIVLQDSQAYPLRFPINQAVGSAK
jgi:flagellar assembly factor FliW